MTYLSPAASSSKAIAAIQESHATDFEFSVPDDWRVGMLLAATVAGSLERFGGGGLSEVDFLLAFSNPSEMPLEIFKLLQEFEEELEAAVARGEDCLETSMGLHGEVARLLDAAPWTVHPVHGLVRHDEIDKLNRRAARATPGQAQSAEKKEGAGEAVRQPIAVCTSRTPVARLRALHTTMRKPAKQAARELQHSL